jgi:hypothetical protein
MNAESELLRVYREWRRLVQAEAKAIQTRNWVLFSDCHLAIKGYQSAVTGLTQATRAEWRRAGGEVAQKERSLEVLVADLADLTRRNLSLLQARRVLAGKQLHELGEAGRNLRRLRRAYGVLPAGDRAFA